MISNNKNNIILYKVLYYVISILLNEKTALAKRAA